MGGYGSGMGGNGGMCCEMKYVEGASDPAMDGAYVLLQQVASWDVPEWCNSPCIYARKEDMEMMKEEGYGGMGGEYGSGYGGMGSGYGGMGSGYGMENGTDGSGMGMKQSGMEGSDMGSGYGSMGGNGSGYGSMGENGSEYGSGYGSMEGYGSEEEMMMMMMKVQKYCFKRSKNAQSMCKTPGMGGMGKILFIS